MLTPIQEQAVQLYTLGKDLREVAETLGRSHEWVRKTLVIAGVPTRARGRESTGRPLCLECGKPCGAIRSQYCSRVCLNKNRHDVAMVRVNKALVLLKQGTSFAEAAKQAGFSNGWHLWGRLYHFGLTEGLREPAAAKKTEG